MKKLLLIALVLLTLVGCSLSHEEKIRKSVKNQLERYPQSTLVDIYKNFYQEYFGPAHIIPNKESVARFLNRELELIDADYPVWYEKIGCDGKYYRVSIAVVKQGLVSEEDFVSAFIRSGKGGERPEIEEWAEEWAKIYAVIQDMNLKLPNERRDHDAIDFMMGKSRADMHHSRQFKNAYNPHYRIIEASIFEKELLPKLK